MKEIPSATKKKGSMMQITDTILSEDKYYWCPRCGRRLSRFATSPRWCGMAHVTCYDCNVVWRWKTTEYEIVVLPAPPEGKVR